MVYKLVRKAVKLFKGRTKYSVGVSPRAGWDDAIIITSTKQDSTK